MIITNWTNVLDPDFPAIDRALVTPSVDEVARLERTRTVDVSGAEQATFTADTRPTATEAADEIDTATELVLADVPIHLPEAYYPRLKLAIGLQAAILIEISYYREQYNQGSAQAYEAMLDRVMKSLEYVVGGSGSGSRVDSLVQRSTMAEYQPDYVMPPPRVIPQTPFPIDTSSPDEEGEF